MCAALRLTHSVYEVLVISLLMAVDRLLLPVDERMERREQIGRDKKKTITGRKGRRRAL